MKNLSIKTLTEQLSISPLKGNLAKKIISTVYNRGANTDYNLSDANQIYNNIQSLVKFLGKAKTKLVLIETSLHLENKLQEIKEDPFFMIDYLHCERDSIKRVYLEAINLINKLSFDIYNTITK